MTCTKCGKKVRGRPSVTGVCPACRAGGVESDPVKAEVPGAEAVGPVEPHCYPADGVAVNPSVK